MPFLNLSEPHRFVSPMAYAIFMSLISLLAFFVGVPASAATIHQQRPVLGWVAMVGCVLMFPISLAALRVASCVLGIPINLSP